MAKPDTNPNKPRLYKTHYPALGYAYWRVTPQPKRASPEVRDRWKMAHACADKLNAQIHREETAKKLQRSKKSLTRKAEPLE